MDLSTSKNPAQLAQCPRGTRRMSLAGLIISNYLLLPGFYCILSKDTSLMPSEESFEAAWDFKIKSISKYFLRQEKVCHDLLRTVKFFYKEVSVGFFYLGTKIYSVTICYIRKKTHKMMLENILQHHLLNKPLNMLTLPPTQSHHC